MKRSPQRSRASLIARTFVAISLAATANATEPLKALTWNVYIGANLEIITDTKNLFQFPSNVTTFVTAVANTRFGERAELIADEIQRQAPDLVGLQEVALYRIQGTGDFFVGNLEPNATEVLIDFLTTLQAKLQQRGLQYTVAAIGENADVELPSTLDLDRNRIPDDIRLTDRDVILARSDVVTSAPTATTFNRLLEIESPIPGFTLKITRGFVSVDAIVGGSSYRFTTTHLENKLDDSSVQSDQAAELIAALQASPIPVVLAGDLNSSPLDTNNLPYPQFVNAAYLDAWGNLAGGFTCCRDDNLLNPASNLTTRIDQVWLRDTDPSSLAAPSLQAAVVGADPAIRTPSGLWPSDHAGVIATLALGPKLFAAVLPSSRSVSIGQTATAFASIVNAGDQPAVACGIAPATASPGTFLYQTTDAQDNSLSGAPNTPVDIAPGATQSYLMSFQLTSALAPTEIQFNFSCTSADPAPVLSGVNTLLLSASTTPTPDVLAVAATAPTPGFVDIPGETGLGAFSVAAINIGSAATLDVTPRPSHAGLPLTLAICQSDALAQCLPGNARAPSVAVDFEQNQVLTFTVGAQGAGLIAGDPAANRIVVEFRDSADAVRGSTSVAVRSSSP